ncbi:trypsin 5G1-like [Coccinella septempunctata]|uniref:trypsin 5G1-like n=1 Tax=Coccinella septempunctata TaxID=41139 RepID=UPI001D08A9DB|nr:trypsin 5G1-like [Coccinella septempunctata]
MLLLCIISIIFFTGYIQGSKDPTSRIAGGYEVNIEDYPYVVSIHVDTGIELKFNCGGSLISPQFVLSAAHCFPKTVHYYVVKAGTDRLEGPGGRTERVTSVKKHPKYGLNWMDSDIAVAKLKKPMVLSEKINIVKLPSFSKDVPLTEGTVLGWGRRGLLFEDSEYLRAVDLPIIDEEECVRSHSRRTITKRMFCTKLVCGYKTPCQGDSGGPFVINGTVYGVVSWGGGCDEYPYLPAVFTRVPYFVDFINKSLSEDF